MAKTKQQKQEEALAGLTASIADDLANGRSTPLVKRQEYNHLKAALGQSGRMI